jgi:uncharacterized protein YggE
MKKLMLASTMVLALPAAAAAQTVNGTRLDVVATGEVTRVPDVARIGAGVVTQAATASAAIQQNAQQMARVRAALKRAGIADRDIQTSSINLNPEYRYVENRPPVLTGYRAGNEVTVRFRDLANTGRILDALVAEGANQINGPTLTLDKPDEALDEARTAALRKAQARAEMYARSLGKRVARGCGERDGSGLPALSEADDGGGPRNGCGCGIEDRSRRTVRHREPHRHVRPGIDWPDWLRTVLSRAPTRPTTRWPVRRC